MITLCNVASGDTESGYIHLGSDAGQMGIVGIVTPSALTSTTMTLVAAIDGSTDKAITDVYGVSQTITISADKFIALDPAFYAGVPYIKIVTGSAEAGDRIFALIIREIT